MAVIGNNLRDWMTKSFLNEKLSDYAIWVKSGDSCFRFPCHKMILASKSDVFAEIFTNLSSEDESCIVMENENPDAVFKVLEYIYTGYIRLKDWILACDVLKIVEKYEIKGIIKECEDFISKEINVHNICYIFEKVLLVNSTCLEKRCLEFCQKYGFLILNSYAFQTANLGIVKRILSLPDLQIENEWTVFNAAWKWATYICCKKGKIISDENITNEMNPILECIVFKFISESQINLIPKAALEKFHLLRPNLMLNSEENFNCRKILFPLDDTYGSINFCFEFEFSSKIHLTGKAIIMKFAVNAKMYLKEIGYCFPEQRLYALPKKSITQKKSMAIDYKPHAFITVSGLGRPLKSICNDENYEISSALKPKAVSVSCQTQPYIRFFEFGSVKYSTPAPLTDMPAAPLTSSIDRHAPLTDKPAAPLTDKPAAPLTVTPYDAHSTHLPLISIYSCKGTLVSHHYPLEGFVTPSENSSYSERYFHFKANELLLVEANEEYTIEVDSTDLLWFPLVYERSKKCGNIEINFEQTCYGISELKFLEIP